MWVREIVLDMGKKLIPNLFGLTIEQQDFALESQKNTNLKYKTLIQIRRKFCKT